eukprot:3112409-Pyramimonas_sp.AAC.1
MPHGTWAATAPLDLEQVYERVSRCDLHRAACQRGLSLKMPRGLRAVFAGERTSQHGQGGISQGAGGWG